MRRWAEFRPWQTNAALLAIGIAMIGFMRQVVVEFDHYEIGYSGCSSSMFLLYLAALAIFLFKPANVDRYTFPIILSIAIACRLVVLFEPPTLSSDVYRYAWDGVVQHAGINPFRYVPGDLALKALREPNQDLFDNMNRRDYAHTIYPPVAQMGFFLITWISPTLTFMKVAMVLCEGLMLVGLVKLLELLGMAREWAIVYAWCPLAIWEFGSSGHVDALVMAFLVFALLFRWRRQPVLTGLFFGLAVFSKFYPIVLLPAMILRKGWKIEWKMPATLAAVGVLCYLPYLSVGKMVFGFMGGYVKEEGMASGARYFLLDLVQHLPGTAQLPEAAFLGFAVLVMGSLSLWAWRTGCLDASPRSAFLPPATGLAMAMMLLFSPHYPWYIAWLIPFLVLVPNLTLLTYLGGLFYLCTTALAVGYGPQQYQLNEILYSALLLAFLIEVSIRRIPAVRAWYARLTPVLSGLEPAAAVEGGAHDARAALTR
jgi:hypothetical protein